MNKKKQHYVWKYYLKKWANNDKIFCRQDGQIFESALTGIANIRYFYRTEELNDEDVQFIEKFVIETSPPFLRQSHRNYIEIFNLPFQWIYQLSLHFTDQSKISSFRKYIENNGVEEMQSTIEQISIKYLDCLLRKDISFFEDADSKSEFLFFLFIQYLRTNKNKSIIVDNCEIFKNLNPRFKKINPESIWNVLCFILATNLAHGNKNCKLYLLQNYSNLPFITADQPVVNTQGTEMPKGEQVERIELYYPLSPQLAVLLTEDNIYSNSDLIFGTDKRASNFNSHIVKNSYAQVYGGSREVLEIANFKSQENDFQLSRDRAQYVPETQARQNKSTLEFHSGKASSTICTEGNIGLAKMYLT